jgi:hemolysin III
MRWRLTVFLSAHGVRISNRDFPQAVALIAMVKMLVTEERAQSRREEIANSISSGIGLVAIIGGIPFLLGSAIKHGSKFSLAGAIIFAGTMVSLYLSSTIYHALTRTRIKQLFHLFDHSAIFLLIAGTYTPFALGALRGVWGWTLFAVVWSLAIFGIAFKVLGGLRHRLPSTCLYVGMGWIAVFAIRQFWFHIPWEGLLWIAAGGVAYSTGVVFYLAKRIRYSHFIWHLFVTAGTACHFCAVLWYAG